MDPLTLSPKAHAYLSPSQLGAYLGEFLASQGYADAQWGVLLTVGRAYHVWADQHGTFEVWLCDDGTLRNFSAVYRGMAKSTLTRAGNSTQNGGLRGHPSQMASDQARALHEWYHSAPRGVLRCKNADMGGCLTEGTYYEIRENASGWYFASDGIYVSGGWARDRFEAASVPQVVATIQTQRPGKVVGLPPEDNGGAERRAALGPIDFMAHVRAIAESTRK